jgi:hypothetical protein
LNALDRIRLISAAALISLGVAAASAAGIKGGDAIAVTSEAVWFSRLSPSRTDYGKLHWNGSIALESPDPRFGGFSGIEISQDGKRILAISDQGWWLSASLHHKNGTLDSVTNARIAPLVDSTGKRSNRKSVRDAEALASMTARRIDGDVIVGFERRERVERFSLAAQGFTARPSLVRSPKAISSGPINGELEALAHLWTGPFKGWYLAISEKNFDSAGNIRGWRWRKASTLEFAIIRHEDFRITDLAMLPSGNEFVTIERSFSTGSLPGIALRRFRIADLKAGQPAAGELLLDVRQPLFGIDNMEGITAHKDTAGNTILTLISDDNYNRSIQRTLIIQFRLGD